MAEETKIVFKEEVPLEVLRPVGTNEQILQAWRDFQTLKQVLLTDEDFYTPGGNKATIRKSGWRKMAVAFGLSDEILNAQQEFDPQDAGHWTWRIRARVTSRGGRAVEAVGACSTKERRFAHAEHDTYAMAHTRAKSRAIADMLGAADQIAEEDQGIEEESKPPNPPEGLKSKADKTALARQFTTQVLGADLASLATVTEVKGKMQVMLDRKHCEQHGSSFVSRLLKWGYSVHEMAAGMYAELD